MHVITTGKHAGEIKLTKTEKSRLTEAASILRGIAPHEQDADRSESTSGAAETIERVLEDVEGDASE